MDELKNKEIFSQNLRSLMNKNNKDRNQICDDLGLKYTTFTDRRHTDSTIILFCLNIFRYFYLIRIDRLDNIIYNVDTS